MLFSERALRGLLRATGFEQVESLRPTPDARWLFPPSAALAAGLNPLEEEPPLRLWLRARMAEAVAWRRPAAAEELIFAARRPA